MWYQAQEVPTVAGAVEVAVAAVDDVAAAAAVADVAVAAAAEAIPDHKPGVVG